MKFLPVERLLLKTRLKPGEVRDRISSLINEHRYEGEINDERFSIRRTINYRNSFLPRISGTIYREFDGTTVAVKMRLSRLVIAFSFIWSGGVVFFLLLILSQAFRYGELKPVIFGPLTMLAFFYALTLGAFKYESARAIKDLKTLLGGEWLPEGLNGSY